MPLLGPNNNGSMGTRRHEYFAAWEAKGVRTMVSSTPESHTSALG